MKAWEQGRNSPEFIEMRKQYRERLIKSRLAKKEKKILKWEVPTLTTLLLCASTLPQSYWMYSIIWADPCSDVFFSALEKSVTWIASLNALEGASGCALGYIDYKVKFDTPTK